MSTDTKKKQKRPMLTSPVGTAVFPKINEPDRGQYAKDKEYGDWKIGLRLSVNDEAATKFIRTLQDAYDAVVEQAVAEEEPKAKSARLTKNKLPLDSDSRVGLEATPPFTQEFDDAGNPTGFLRVNFKRKAGGRDTKTGEVWRTNIDLVDAAGTKLDRTKVKVGGGSTIAVAFQVMPFIEGIGAGISLQLYGVQVIERRDAPERTAAELGFQKREGYVYVDDTGADSEATDGPTDESTDRIE